MSYHGLGMPPLISTPPLPPPGGAGFFHPPITAVQRTSGGYQARMQCEGVGGRYEEYCRSAPTMMAPMPNVPGMTSAQSQLCRRTCHLPNGSSSVWGPEGLPSASWSPPLQGCVGCIGDDDSEGTPWYKPVAIALAAAAIAWKVL